MKLKKIGKFAVVLVVSLFLVLILTIFIYSSNYYKADFKAHDILDKQNVEIQDSTIVFNATNNKKDIGYIFYPGAKVEAISYAPLLNYLANQGLNVFLVKMPFNLAIFDINAANAIINDNPKIKTWYVGGHSLGGAMASNFALKNQDRITGQILLAAYPLEQSNLSTLILYGSNDEVISQDRLAPFKDHIMIDGANHAYFGNYGLQAGDGAARISQSLQQEITAKYIIDFINKNDS